MDGNSSRETQTPYSGLHSASRFAWFSWRWRWDPEKEEKKVAPLYQNKGRLTGRYRTHLLQHRWIPLRHPSPLQNPLLNRLRSFCRHQSSSLLRHPNLSQNPLRRLLWRSTRTL
jgi:hypothetical protein